METPVSIEGIVRLRRLDMQVCLLRYRRGYARIKGIASVDGNTAAEGGFMSAMAEE